MTNVNFETLQNVLNRVKVLAVKLEVFSLKDNGVESFLSNNTAVGQSTKGYFLKLDDRNVYATNEDNMANMLNYVQFLEQSVSNQITDILFLNEMQNTLSDVELLALGVGHLAKNADDVLANIRSKLTAEQLKYVKNFEDMHRSY